MTQCLYTTTIPYTHEPGMIQARMELWQEDVNRNDYMLVYQLWVCMVMVVQTTTSDFVLDPTLLDADPDLAYGAVCLAFAKSMRMGNGLEAMVQRRVEGARMALRNNPLVSWLAPSELQEETP